MIYIISLIRFQLSLTLICLLSEFVPFPNLGTFLLFGDHSPFGALNIWGLHSDMICHEALLSIAVMGWRCDRWRNFWSRSIVFRVFTRVLGFWYPLTRHQLCPFEEFWVKRSGRWKEGSSIALISFVLQIDSRFWIGLVVLVLCYWGFLGSHVFACFPFHAHPDSRVRLPARQDEHGNAEQSEHLTKCVTDRESSVCVFLGMPINIGFYAALFVCCLVDTLTP